MPMALAVRIDVKTNVGVTRFIMSFWSAAEGGLNIERMASATDCCEGLSHRVEMKSSRRDA